MAQAMLCDTKEIDAELARLRQELEVVAELSRKEIHRSAHSPERQEETSSSGYLERYKLARERIETLEQGKLERIAKSKAIGRFIRSIRGTSELLNQFDEALWIAIVDSVTVLRNGEMLFRFKNDYEVIFNS